MDCDEKLLRSVALLPCSQNFLLLSKDNTKHLLQQMNYPELLKLSELLNVDSFPGTTQKDGTINDKIYKSKNIGEYLEIQERLCIFATVCS